MPHRGKARLSNRRWQQPERKATKFASSVVRSEVIGKSSSHAVGLILVAKAVGAVTAVSKLSLPALVMLTQLSLKMALCLEIQESPFVARPGYYVIS